MVVQTDRGHPRLAHPHLFEQRAEHARVRRFPRGGELRFRAASVLGDPVEVDDDGPVSEVGGHGSDLDPVHEDHAAEREHGQPVIAVQLAAHVAVTGHGPAQRVRQPRRDRGEAVQPDHPRARRRAVALASDGVALERYPAGATWSALYTGAEQRGAEQVLRSIHEAELTDPNGKRWPRSKGHDDKTLVVIRFARA